MRTLVADTFTTTLSSRASCLTTSYPSLRHSHHERVASLPPTLHYDTLITSELPHHLTPFTTTLSSRPSCLTTSYPSLQHSHHERVASPPHTLHYDTLFKTTGTFTTFLHLKYISLLIAKIIFVFKITYKLCKKILSYPAIYIFTASAYKKISPE